MILKVKTNIHLIYVWLILTKLFFFQFSIWLFPTLCMFCTTQKLFKYLNWLKISINCWKCVENWHHPILCLLSFKFCLDNQIFSKYLDFQISKYHVHYSSIIEWAFLLDEINNIKIQVARIRCSYIYLWTQLRTFLSFFNMICLCHYISLNGKCIIDFATCRHWRNISFLTCK